VPPAFRAVIFRIGGVLLLLLGVLHLAVTPFIAQLVEQAATPDAARWLMPPMLLNHIVVGVLLLPLGALTLFAARDAAADVRWAVVTSSASALTVATFPPLIVVLMGSRYTAVPFMIAVGIATAAAVILLVAAFWPATAA
jgi:hypothetical protein